MHSAMACFSMPAGLAHPTHTDICFSREARCYSFGCASIPNPQSETTMQRTTRWLAAATLLALAAGAHAQVNQIRVWAAACANCHGTEGRAEPGMIGLAARNKDELLLQLLAFKNGQRPATIMHQLSKGYSDEQLAQIAAYFAAQKK
jgi:sulfide dehydrogenase cytochrome subunit